VVAAVTFSNFGRVRGRIGKKADHDVAARLTAQLYFVALQCLRKADADILELSRRGSAFRRQPAHVLRDERQRVVQLEGADHEKCEVGRIREALAVKPQHLLAAQRGNAFGRQRLRRVVVRRVHLLHALAEHLSGRPPAIGHCGRQLPLEDVQLLRIVARSHEVLIEQLEPGLEIGGRRVP